MSDMTTVTPDQDKSPIHIHEPIGPADNHGMVTCRCGLFGWPRENGVIRWYGEPLRVPEFELHKGDRVLSRLRCYSCGETVRTSFRFCPSCGVSLEE